MAKALAIIIALCCPAAPVEAQPRPKPKPIGIEQQIKPTQVDFVFDNAVRKTRDLPTAALRAARKKMISGAQMRPKELQALADAGDGLAAYRFARYMQEQATPDPTGVAAHYYAIAAYTGRAFAVPPLGRLLKSDGAAYSASRLKHALNAMTVQAISGNAEATMLLGQMYSAGTPFGYDLAKAEGFLGMNPSGGSPKAVLQLGMALMADPADAASGHPGARSALTLAAEGEDLSVRVTAENLLRLIDRMPSPEPKVTE